MDVLREYPYLVKQTYVWAWSPHQEALWGLQVSNTLFIHPTPFVRRGLFEDHMTLSSPPLLAKQAMGHLLFKIFHWGFLLPMQSLPREKLWIKSAYHRTPIMACAPWLPVAQPPVEFIFLVQERKRLCSPGVSLTSHPSRSDLDHALASFGKGLC